MQKEKGRGLPTTRLRIAAAVVILGCTLSLSLGYALAQTSPTPSPPKALSLYGVARIYASVTFTGHAQITITSLEAAPFFVSGLTLFLSLPTTSNIVLTTINIDNTGAIQLSASGSAPSSQIVIVPSGLTYGDIVQSMPSYLSFLMMKDPLGNNAIVANGGSCGNGSCGIVITLGFMAGGYGASTTLLVIATVVAPSDTKVAMTIT
jgi:hypothetical protein